MNPDGEIVGMADVLKLTYATLEQVRIDLESHAGITFANAGKYRSPQFKPLIPKVLPGIGSGSPLRTIPNPSSQMARTDNHL
jgi:hypothetical protein